MRAPFAIVAAAALGLATTSPATADLAVLGALLPGLASEDAVTQMTSGFAACLKDLGDAEAMAASFTENEWLRRDDPEAGLIELEHPTSERTFATLADDGSFCHVESISLTTAQAAKTLTFVLDIAGYADRRIATDEAGCMTIVIGEAIVAGVSSGGQDPVCSSELTSAIRFTPTTPD